MVFKKDSDSGLSPEIARLSAQLARDPKSKLFIPLAEEYMKAGMAEEAIMTLEEGMKAHPAYMSARVLLGKAYFQKGDMEQACEQFEAVIKAVPDNLFAHKKLGEIYVAQGRREAALKSYRILALLSPKDEELSYIVGELQAGRLPEMQAPATAEPSAEAPTPPAPAAAAPPKVSPPAAPARPMPPEPADSFLSAEKSSATETAAAPGFLEEPGVVEMPVPEMDTLYNAGPVQEQTPGADEEALPGSDVPYAGSDVQVYDLDSAITDEGPDVDIPHGGVYEIDLDADTGFGQAGGYEIDAGASGPGADEGPAQGGVYELDIDAPLTDEAVGDAGQKPPGGYSVETSASAKIKDIFSSYGEGPSVEEAEPAVSAVYEITDDTSGFDMEEPGAIAGLPEGPGEPVQLTGGMPFDMEVAGDETVSSEIDFGTVEADVQPEEPPFEMMEDEEPFAEQPFDISGGEEDIQVAQPYEMMAAEESFGGGEPFEMSGGDDEVQVAPPYEMMEAEEPFGGEPFEMSGGDDEIQVASPFEMMEAGEADVFPGAVETVVEEVPPAPAAQHGAHKEPINTDTLAELYIKQGFYDRAFNIYNEMLKENPGDPVLRQKIEELNMLAGLAYSRSTAEVPEVPAEAAEVYEPEVFAQPFEDTGGPGAGGIDTGTAGDPEAAARLEQFLDEIRKRGKQ
ncbi:MAG TPA: tetratricopeptide repeat protein [Nitrospirota bacterium]